MTVNNDRLKAERLEVLSRLTSRVLDSALGGLFSKTSIPIVRVIQIPGPRTGILELYAGYHNGALMTGLETNNMALLRQLLWDGFQGEPQVYLFGKAVRIETGWPPGLMTSEIRLSELHLMKPTSGRFVLGQNIMGQTVTIGLDSERAHMIVAGTTGSGKSVTLQSITYQLALDQDQLILVDGKMGEGLQNLDRLPNVIGPVAVTPDAVQRALAFGALQMYQRYTQRLPSTPKIVLVVDEIQEFRNDPIIVELIRKIASQGRGAGVHLILATQHPTNEVIGDPTIKRNTTIRIGLRVMDVSSSQAVMGGSTPRLDYLLGQGDAWSQTPRSLHRVQVAMLDSKLLKTQLKYQPAFSEWPELSETLRKAPDLLNLEELTKPTTTKAIQFSGRQIGMAMMARARAQSRAELIRQLEGAGTGVSRKTSVRLWEIAQETLSTMHHQGALITIDGQNYEEEEEEPDNE